jgi:hypothetical protein
MRSPPSELAVTPVPTLDDVMRELLEQRRELLEHRALLRQLLERRPTPLSAADRDRLARVLPAIVGAFGSEPFTSRDLLADAAVRLTVRPMTAKQIGKLLARAAGVPIEGLIVERDGAELKACLWRVVACAVSAV